MATLVEQAPQIPSRPTTPPPHLTLNTSVRGTPAPVPNKHIPVCSPGRAPGAALTTPPKSPPARSLSDSVTSYVLHPADPYPIVSLTPKLHALEPDKVFEALEQYATQPLPDSKLVFPWLHGLHADNAIQLAFFVARRRTLRRVPQALRGITVVKAGGDLSKSRLKGAVTAEELLSGQSLTLSAKDSMFKEADPRDGFSVRNFQIQTCKMASVSDIIVYGDDETPAEEVLLLGEKMAWAQKAMREKLYSIGWDSGEFNTFVVLNSFKEFEENHPDLVAISSNGIPTGNVHDFFMSERCEMAQMTRAMEIAPNVFLGPTPDPMIPASTPEQAFDVFIEASDLAQVPDFQTLIALRAAANSPEHPTVHFEFPGSGSIMPPTWSHAEVDGLLNTCKWIWDVSKGLPMDQPCSESDTSAGAVVPEPTAEKDEEVDMIEDDANDRKSRTLRPTKSDVQPRQILIHCPDGYTESTLLGMTYFMFAHGLPVSEAWIKLHKDYERNFFAYATDVALLSAIQTRILNDSPARRTAGPAPAISLNTSPDPEWLHKMDGSLPSRILPYMYLGNLAHANNAALLRELGIRRIVSVGEKVSWGDGPVSSPTKIDGGSYDGFEFIMVENVQDNGVDSLTCEIEKCLDFIERGKADGIATLVHCRVGVSRSATICIAEVMKEMNVSFPKAYCFVRARRLNVIIQPHLRFTYELLQWEEEMNIRAGRPLRRELEWATVAREIAAMNRPYARS